MGTLVVGAILLIDGVLLVINGVLELFSPRYLMWRQSKIGFGRKVSEEETRAFSNRFSVSVASLSAGVSSIVLGLIAIFFYT